MKRNIKWFFIGFGAILIYSLLVLMSMFREPIGFGLGGIVWISASLLLIWELAARIFNRIHKPKDIVTFLSALKFFLISLPSGILLFDIVYVVFRLVEPFIDNTPFDISWVHLLVSSAVGGILTIITTSVILLVETVSRWKNVELSMEKMKRQNADIQLSSLKQQISPHFLFNNLNTLQTLVKEKSEYSLPFIQHMATLYRYVLDHQHDELVTFRLELEFVNSYIKLLKERFGEGVDVQIAVETSHLDQHVPTLSIYTLIENAIKHNKASVENPLNIRLSSSENLIVVSNNTMPKENVVSNKLGLKNLSERYTLLNKDLVIEQTNEQYVVKLPLIEVRNYESTTC